VRAYLIKADRGAQIKDKPNINWQEAVSGGERASN